MSPRSRWWFLHVDILYFLNLFLRSLPFVLLLHVKSYECLVSSQILGGIKIKSDLDMLSSEMLEMSQRQFDIGYGLEDWVDRARE